jgi:hypothetical protein
MLLDARLSDGGVRHQRDLINFVNHVDANAATKATTESSRKLIHLRASIQARMNANEWFLVETARFSAADLAGMDYVLYSRKRRRYHFIDVTTDAAIKWSLPELRRRNLFVIELDEAGDMTDETRRGFLEYLGAAMGSENYLPLDACEFPSLKAQNPRETAESIETFRARLQSWMEEMRDQARLHKGRASVLNGTIAVVREYREHLARFAKFANEENVRQTDPDHLRRQAILIAWAFKCVDQAVRMTIQDSAYPPRLGPHHAEFDERRDQITLCIPGGKLFHLSHVRALVSKSNARVWEKKTMTPELWRRKGIILSEAGQIKCGEYLARLIESVNLEVLVGKPAEVPHSAPLKVMPAVEPVAEPEPEKAAPTIPPASVIAAGPRRTILTLKRTPS